MKTRQYAFTCYNAEEETHGTFFFTAKNLARAEELRWAWHENPEHPISCAGFVGPMAAGKWVEGEPRGFVSTDTLQAEWRASLPEVEHDPAMLEEFVSKHGREPERGNELRRNLLSGGVFEQAPGTPSSCDPSTEAYHSM